MSGKAKAKDAPMAMGREDSSPAKKKPKKAPKPAKTTGMWRCEACKKDTFQSERGYICHRIRCPVLRKRELADVLRRAPPPSFSYRPTHLQAHMPAPAPDELSFMFEGNSGYDADADIDTTVDVTHQKKVYAKEQQTGQDRAVTYRSDLTFARPSIRTEAAQRTALRKAARDAEPIKEMMELDIHESDEDMGDDTAYGGPPPPVPPEATREGADENDVDFDDNEEESDSDLSESDLAAAASQKWNEQYFPDHDKEVARIVKDLQARWEFYKLNVVHDIPVEPTPEEFGTEPDNDLPLYYVAQVSLLKLLSQHRGNDLKLFDRIMEWVVEYTKVDPGIWSHHQVLPIRTRDRLMHRLTETFDLSGLLPVPKHVDLMGGSRTTIMVFDPIVHIRRLVTDPDIMKDEHLLEHHFNKDTWRPTKTYEELSDDDVISDFNGGRLFHEGIAEYCPEGAPPPPGIDMILPCPLSLFVDESHADTHGGNKTKPYYLTLAVFNAACRAQFKFGFNFAFTPDLYLGKGKNKNKYDDEFVRNGRKKGTKTLTDAEVARHNLYNRNRVYNAALEQLKRICEKVGGVTVMYKGKRCLLKLFVLEVHSDTKEYNDMCNHYQSCRATSICKDCTCTHSDIVNQIPPRCRPIDRADRWKAVHDPEYAKLISQHPCVSAWDELPLSDIRGGISSITPLEPLHVMHLGTYQDGPLCIHDLIDPSPTAKTAAKERVDLLLDHIGYALTRCAERDRPRHANRAGGLEISRKTAGEHAGIYLLLAILLATHAGAEVLRKSLEKKGPDGSNLLPENMMETMCLAMAYEQWAKCPKTTKGELRRAPAAVAHLMQSMIRYLPRDVRKGQKRVPGSMGYHKVKFHALWLMLGYMEKFGSARGWDGEHGERFHKVSVKNNKEHTQKRPKLFTCQVGHADGNRAIVDAAYPKVKHRDPLGLDARDPNAPPNTDEHRLHYDGAITTASLNDGEGHYSLHAKPKEGRRDKRSFTHEWRHLKKNVLNHGLSSDLLFAIAEHANRNHWTDSINIRGFTALRTQSRGGNTTYRATEYMYGGKWYDWALVDDPGEPGAQFIGKILGFVQYETPGYPTYKLTEIDGMDKRHILSAEATDPTVYVVLRGSTECITDAQLRSRLITPFSLQSKDETTLPTYFFPATCIRKPLLVVPNFGSPSSTDYLTILPRREWAGLFRAKIDELSSDS